MLPILSEGQLYFLFYFTKHKNLFLYFGFAFFNLSQLRGGAE